MTVRQASAGWIAAAGWLLVACAGPGPAATTTAQPSSPPLPTQSSAPTSPPTSVSATVPPDWLAHQSVQGYTIYAPSDWEFQAASAAWPANTDPAFTDEVWDRVGPAGGSPQLLAAGQAIPEGTDPDQWLCHRVNPLLGPGTCDVAALSDKVVGPAVGRFRAIPEGFAAGTVVNGRGYLFVLLTPKSHESAVLFDSLLAAISFGG